MGETKYENVIRLILEEKWLTITVIGSVFTFQFISAFKNEILDPLMDYLLIYDKFSFMDITLKDGEEYQNRPLNAKVMLRVGSFFIEFLKWGTMMVLLYFLGKYTKFPETKYGNVTGAAIM